MEAILGIMCLFSVFGCPGALVVWVALAILSAPARMSRRSWRKRW